MALILSIETGTDVCSVALGDDGELISIRESVRGRDHANKLARYIEEILKANDLKVADLDAVAVSAGPGSYTGLRIGVSTAKGICYPTKKPLIAIDSLRSLANIAVEEYKESLLSIDNPGEVKLVPMIDARRMEVYAQVFDLNMKTYTEIEAKIIDADSFSEEESIIIFGDGAEKCLDVIKHKSIRLIDIASSARGLVSIAEEMYQRHEFVDVAYYEPLYLKDFVAKRPKKSVLDL